MRTRKHGSTYPFAFATAIAVAVILPSVIYLLVQHSNRHFLFQLQWVVIIAFSVASSISVIESLASFNPRRPIYTEEEHSAILKQGSTAIIAAYLPNESDIIVSTIKHFLEEIDQPEGKLQVILAYNTPHPLEVEDELRQLETEDERLLVYHAVDSHSKAENVNAALSFATGAVIGIFDADHMPASDVFMRAAAWMAAGWDMVQGRCVIRNTSTNLLTRIVDVEFHTIYGVSHPGRFAVTGTAIFGGSNGFWKSSVLKEFAMDPRMLTEDIDLSVRALISGRKLAHDSGILSTELAPLKWSHWLSQRKRWAQGWFEVTIRHSARIVGCRDLTLFQRVAWWYLLPWREVYPIIGAQFFPLVVCALIVGAHLHWFASAFMIATSSLNLSSAFVVVLITWCNARGTAPNVRPLRFLGYSALCIPYTTFKTLVSLIAQVAHFTREKAWVTTPRGQETPKEHLRSAKLTTYR